ncbi:MAG: acetoacetate decarboxylase family protein, partial [Solirubrobacteraceae bacterium]
MSGERLTIEFVTDPAAVEHLLPPPLEPANAPRVLASVGRWQGSCIGDYSGGSIYLAARHDGLDGGYPIAMWMDSEASCFFGREVFGEPKKLASYGVFRNGDHVHAYIERHGVRLLDLHADLGPDLGPSPADAYAFNYKARPAANGIGLDGPARVTLVHFQ